MRDSSSSMHRRPSLPAIILLLSLSITSICHQHVTLTDATAISAKTSRRCNNNNNDNPSTLQYVASTATADAVTMSSTTSSSGSSGNPVIQLVTYVKDTLLNFKNGLTQMASNHKRCNAIRARQVDYLNNHCDGTTSEEDKKRKRKRPRGVMGIQVGGISYEDYDFLKKGLVDRNKLLAVTVVMLCLPNYFVYYLWSFPEMMPSPFLTPKDATEISRERCHAVLSTFLDMEKGAKVPPLTSKLNPFGKKSTERAMERLSMLVDKACDVLSLENAYGPSQGATLIMNTLQSTFYTKEEPNRQQLNLSSKYFPKQIFKGLNKVIAADPLNKGSSPFGIGLIKHIESISLADEFLIRQNVNVDEINSELLREACSARLIGGPNWSDEERRAGLVTWLHSLEGLESKVTRKKAPTTTTTAAAAVPVAEQEDLGNNDPTDDEMLYLNPNLARAVYMCYNALDATRDGRSESRLGRALYQGQLVKKEGATAGSG